MSHEDHRPILVIGATGRQGGAAARYLLAAGYPMRAMTRDSSKAAARALVSQGAEVVQGDLDDREFIAGAVAGTSGVYSVQDYWSVGAEREVAQGIAVAEAAVSAQVGHLVYSSVGGAERNAEIEHWDTKWRVEQRIRELGIPATIFRPAGFMEDYYSPQVEQAILNGKLIDGVEADMPYQTIAADDIGKFVALAFQRPDRFVGVELEIAGSQLTNVEAAEVFARVIGRPVTFELMPMEVVQSIGEEYFQMYRWFNRGGFKADIDALRRDYPEIGLRSLEQWLREEGWEGRREVSIARDQMGRPLEAALTPGPSR